MRIRLDSEAAQIAFGRLIAEHIRPPLVIYLQGDLGAGKTTLTRGVLRGLDHSGPVRSPTYTLLEPYELPSIRLYHLDLYRLSDPEELEFLGLRDLLDGQSLLFVEWPERCEGSLPSADLRIRIAHADESRILELVAEGSRGAELVSRLRASSTGASQRENNPEEDTDASVASPRPRARS
jgi:tRNA threonylcarbamoyladenosine biosynthesis protein TsaE